MARHILHGQFTTFFWGQGYGGSQEALLTAPIFAVVRLELARAPLRSDRTLGSHGDPHLARRVAADGRAPGCNGSGRLLDLAPVPDLQADAPVGLLRERRPVLHPPRPAGAACRRAAEHVESRRVRARPGAGRLGDRADRSDRDPADGVDGLEEARLAPQALDRRTCGAGRRCPVDRLERPPRLGLVPIDRPGHLELLAPAAGVPLADHAADARPTRGLHAGAHAAVGDRDVRDRSAARRALRVGRVEVPPAGRSRCSMWSRPPTRSSTRSRPRPCSNATRSTSSSSHPSSCCSSPSWPPPIPVRSCCSCSRPSSR